MMIWVPIWPAVLLWVFSILLMSRSVEKRDNEIFSFAMILSGLSIVVSAYCYAVLLHSSEDPFGRSFLLTELQSLVLFLEVGFGLFMTVLGITSAAANLPRWFVSSR